MFKKCVAMFLGVVLIFSMIPYASAVEGKDKYVVAKEVILKTQEEFIQSMKKLSPKNYLLKTMMKQMNFPLNTSKIIRLTKNT
ncbi:hypothetical protein MOB49_02350 [Bacillus haynesii]|uniref:hypothetical protein n=1 Tax=Bacillus haynesii TaxID=1925021 RepID=UPI00227DD24C|nr:hypothetical protein [Bacillus haynesii]MCY7965913.1 hypothetical protein [Bacillus haynesii]MCY8391216.1 hypothetical protein [Bacillus haynesii]MCY8400209.1 hypothetical protein [Bacillus haynesii]MCY9213711.1 hypothetical protein [Bacillus haynesii]MEC1577366.1 hypothetical protein [Bacillus haynesii]